MSDDTQHSHRRKLMVMPLAFFGAVALTMGSSATAAIGASTPLTLANASTFTIHGTRSADGTCQYAGNEPSATLAPDEEAVAVQEVASDEATCTETWERGTPSLAELAAEAIPSSSSHPNSASATSEPPRAASASRRRPRAHKASTEYGGYTYARSHGINGEVNAGINASVVYYSNGSCDTSASYEAHWYWEGPWYVESSKNSHTGVSCAEAYTSVYGSFRNGEEPCHYEYNRTAVFGEPNGTLRGYWPTTGCGGGPNYAGFLTRTH